MKLLIKFTFVYLFIVSIVSGQTKITLLHYNDFHAHLVTHKDYVREDHTCQTNHNSDAVVGMRGGIARLYTLVKQYRNFNSNTILMNIGDTFHGGVEATYTSGNAITSPINMLGIDVSVPGNWDFAYGPGVFRARFTEAPIPIMLQQTMPPFEIEKTTFPSLAANVKFQNLGPFDPTINGSDVLPPTKIIEKSGIKVGFIGITSDIVPQMYQALALGFNFIEGEENYIELINSYKNELKQQGADIVVVMSELGIHKDYQLAQKIENGVDVFFSAHTHEATYTPLESLSGAIVVEAGNDGFLGVMNIIVNNGSIVSKEWELIPIDESVAEDTDMIELVDSIRAPFLEADVYIQDPMGQSPQVLNKPINTIVGYTNSLLTRMNALESSFNNAFTDLLRQKSGADVAISPGFRFDAPLAPNGYLFEDNTIADGSITLEELYRFFPVLYTLATANVTVDSLKFITEKLLTNVFSENAFKQGGGWVDGFSGVSMEIDLTNDDFAKVLSFKDSDNNLILDDNDTLFAIGCQRPMEANNILCSHTGFFNKLSFIDSSSGLVYNPIDLILEVLSSDTLNVLERQSIMEINDYAIWPQYPFLQPLPEDISCYTTSVNENINYLEIPTSYSISQNYPNPFNPTTVINFSLPEATEVSLKIFNLLGEEVTELVNEMKAAGNYEVQFDASDLSSGVYFYSIQAGNFTAVKKMMLLK